jgi:hypothetical protein
MAEPTLTGKLSELRQLTLNLRHREALDEAISILDPRANHELTVLELEDKYTGCERWGECPDWSREDWRTEVSDEETQLGYWEWVYNKVQNEERT